jgi:two-component system NtrC family sensor kinase
MEGLNKTNHPLNRIGKSLAAKLIFSIAALLLIGGGFSWYLLISSSKENLIKDAIKEAAAYSDLVRRSTRFSMLTFHRDAIQQTVEEISSRKDIEHIRIFDGRGRISYSSKRREIGGRADRKEAACAGCHRDSANPSETLRHDGQSSISDIGGRRVLTFIEPIYNGPSCFEAACHVHPPGQRVLGILQTDFSLSAVDDTIRRQTLAITLFAAAFMALSALVLYIILSRFVLNPVSLISKAMRKVSGGDLQQAVSVGSEDEMGQLAATFNVMAKDLALARDRMENWTMALEEGIAKKTEELRRSQDKLIQAEKLASLGRLTADVAHEIRNPLTAVGGFARRLNKVATGTKEREYAEIMLVEVDRLEKILRDILTFSRDARSHLEKNDLSEIVDDALKIYENLFAEQSIRVEVKAEGGILPVLIDKDQVRQALRNLINNAIDAMPDGGALTVLAGKEELHDITYMFLRVSDSGAGIAQEDLPLIFEPFFSTKTSTHGTGLGLSITRKIMEEHGGFIKAENVAGGGSAFTLYFPFQSDEESMEVKCWEYMKCGRDKDASLKCPSYPNFGRVCWAVAGTFCEGKVQGTFAQKYENCKKCEFYKKVEEEKSKRAG